MVGGGGEGVLATLLGGHRDGVLWVVWWTVEASQFRVTIEMNGSMLTWFIEVVV